METILIVFATSALTAFFSNFLAPRSNAWYERKYQDEKILKKTLRTLLEIELYVQRNLKHPGMTLLSDEIIAKSKDLHQISDEQVASLAALAPQIFRSFQSLATSYVPDAAEGLDKAFTTVLDELSVVDPLLAYKISERHVISPIQRLTTLPLDAAKSLGITVSAEDMSLVTPFMDQLKAERIDELLSDLRKDIKLVAAKIGRKMSGQTEDHYEEVEISRRKFVEEKATKLLEYFPKKSENVIEDLEPTAIE